MTVDPTEFGLPADAGRLPSPRSTPWRGPCDDSDNGGVTVELLRRFLDCPERTRLRYVEGLVPEDRLDHKAVFARLFEVARRHYESHGVLMAALDAAYDRCDDLYRRHPGPESTDLLTHWFNVLVPTFSGYVRHRRENDIDQGATRSVRRLPGDDYSRSYELPSGRRVLLRSPRLRPVLVGTGTTEYLRVVRTVVKGDLDPERLQRTARLDLDTMFDAAALSSPTYYPKGHPTDVYEDHDGTPVREVYYDLVRRPLSGGKGAIRRNKPTSKNPEGETATAFYGRLRDTVLDVDPGYWFPHFLVAIEPSDVDEFRRVCLDPALERLCSWWEVQTYHTKIVSFMQPTVAYHGTKPFSLYEPGREYDEYLLTGSERGLVRSRVTFPELGEE